MRNDDVSIRRLELLIQYDKLLGFCPICGSHELDWAGLKVHNVNCAIEKEFIEAGVNKRRIIDNARQRDD
jgi:hypothetical protein